MLKKIITVSILGISALAVMTANAAISTDTSSQATNSPKKHRRTSHHKHKQKELATPMTTSLEANSGSQADQPVYGAASSHGGLPAGLYVSGQVGYADTHIGSRIQNPVGRFSFKNDGLAGRLALGYKLNQIFAIEAGYLQLSQASSSVGTSSTLSNKQNAIDILGKASFPITHNVNLYGKLGAAYLTTKLEENYNVAGMPATKDCNDERGIARHTWAPEVAVGMGYDITPQVSVDTSFTHIHPVGSERPGNVDYLAVGVAYTFG